MKFLKITVLLLLAAQLCQAQDTTVVLSTSMINELNVQINLGALNGWVFKQGNDTGLAKLNMDTAGWKRLRPDELSAKYADKNGRVEGWFRLKVKFDTSLLNKPIYFDFCSWVATEFYVDGNMVATRGNTGENGKAFREYNSDVDPVSLRFNSPAPHILTVHFVGYLSPVPPHDLKAQTQLNGMLTVGGPNYMTNILKLTIITDTFMTLWMVVCAILSVLFWLLLIQNRKEKNLFWIALYTSAFTILIYSVSHFNTGETYNEFAIYSIISSLLLPGIILLLLPILLIKTFKRKLNSKLILALIIFYVLSVLGINLPHSLINQFSFWASIIFVLGICLYYVITSWKSLKGAQWAIVAGLIFSVFSLLAGTTLELIFKNLPNSPYFNYSVLSAFSLSLPLSLLVYVSMRFKEIINEVQLNARKVVELSNEKKVQAENQQKVLEAEVNRQTQEIRTTLDNLKSTQKQLIQSEKMASLGELTAGIAHEIQNPLNFVNNFSEVNKEMLEELKAERLKPTAERDEQTEDEIINDVIDNSEKINHHGKRADAIVKGMLQHSRKTSGQKEPTDINALADEYLRLSYHGLRAKDKSFNAEMKTDFDKSIGKINIIPQDIGRVLLNLFNNAFYAVNEGISSNPNSYKPTVFVGTQKCDDKIQITVRDNGNGIPQNIVDKIFQPFFTTKPTGEGTGLGLSLAYDIIKAHGGTLKVERKVDEGNPDTSGKGTGSKFIIQLPIG
jgi:two-component system, NtrC family, sensor kinase